jgi:acetoin utilization deacetylase AcuC-like enzyme
MFNNAAVMARYLQREHGLDKILILDWDVHHGNGTQHSFEADPSVMYASLHQYPFYPGTGAASETGIGAGAGATLNCPMQAGSADAEYQEAFMERVLPAVNAFGPDAVILSAGFDAHMNDPLAQMNLSTDCYAWMTQRMLEVADQHAGGRLISLLEGGYDLQALSDCVATHVAGLSGNGTDVNAV